MLAKRCSLKHKNSCRFLYLSLWQTVASVVKNRSREKRAFGVCERRCQSAKGLYVSPILPLLPVRHKKSSAVRSSAACLELGRSVLHRDFAVLDTDQRHIGSFGLACKIIHFKEIGILAVAHILVFKVCLVIKGKGVHLNELQIIRVT